MSTATTSTTSTSMTSDPTVGNSDTQPTVTSPVVENNPAPTAAAATTTPADPNAVDPNAEPAQTPPWAQKRINELTAKRYEAERKAEAEAKARTTADVAKAAAEARVAELLAQMANGNPNPQQPAKPASTVSEEEIKKRIHEEAAAIAAAARFNEACDQVANTGKNEYKEEWDKTIQNLKLVGAIGDGANLDFLSTAIELKDAHKILHHLGQNLDEAERIAKMPSTKMALELARIETKLNTPVQVAPPVSNAPPPVNPITGLAKPATPSLDDPSTSSADWFALREKQIAEKNAARYPNRTGR